MGDGDGPWHCQRCRAEKTYPHGWCATAGCDCDECLSPTAAELARELVRKFGEWEFDRNGQVRDVAERQTDAELAELAAQLAVDVDDVIRRAVAWIARPLGQSVEFTNCQLYPGRDCPGCVRTCFRVDAPIPGR